MNLPLTTSAVTSTPAPTSRKQYAVTNASAVWHQGAIEPKLKEHGSTFAAVTLCGKGGDRLSVGLMKTGQGKSVIVGVYKDNDGLSLTFPKELPVPAGNSFYLEADLDAKTGNVKLWVNDTGVDMGEFPRFVGGARRAEWGASASHPEDHLINGRFTNCAVAMIANGWVNATLNQKKVTGIRSPFHQVQVVGVNSIAFSDKRAIG